VPFWELFRFATALDRVMVIVAAICAIAYGLALPLFSLLFRDLMDSLVRAGGEEKLCHRARSERGAGV
jgi:hypothetical protein